MTTCQHGAHTELTRSSSSWTMALTRRQHDVNTECPIRPWSQHETARINTDVTRIYTEPTRIKMERTRIYTEPKRIYTDQHGIAPCGAVLFRVNSIAQRQHGSARSLHGDARSCTELHGGVTYQHGIDTLPTRKSTVPNLMPDEHGWTLQFWTVQNCCVGFPDQHGPPRNIPDHQGSPRINMEWTRNQQGSQHGWTRIAILDDPCSSGSQCDWGLRIITDRCV